MKLETYYDSKNGIIVASAIGEITNENVKITLKEAMELSKQNNCLRILFDITGCSEPQPLIYGYQQMKDGLISEGLSLKHVCAVVYNPVTYPEDRAGFIENVVSNRM